MTIHGENITLTKKELTSMLQSAAEIALRQAGIKIDDSAEEISPSSPSQKEVRMGEFNSEEYADAMQTMAVNRGNGDEPKVGIFWYNIAKNELFGVVSHKTSDYKKPNAGGGHVTCSEMHEDVWKKNFNKQKYHKLEGPYIGAYQDKPRGRIFFTPASGRYTIAVGKWFNVHQEAYDLIMEEFDLPEELTDVKYGEHWDIGQTWM